MNTPARRIAALAAALPAAAIYFAVLSTRLFDGPFWDDYDAILRGTILLREAPGPGDVLRILYTLHNEHWIAVTRLAAWAFSQAEGGIRIPAMILAGNLVVPGLLVLAWLEFGERAGPLAMATAAFLLFQGSYFEASHMASAPLPNIGVMFFAFACLAFATRPGRAPAVAAVVSGLLAVSSFAVGLFALPLAAAGAFLAGLRRRSAVFALVAAATWIAYLLAYQRPPGHPGVMAAIESPLTAIQLFLVIVGGIWPGRWGATLLGAAILALLAWLAWRGLARRHPTAALWVAFVLLGAAAATAGRAGLGVFVASRYAVYSTCLVVIAFLGLHAMTGPWGKARSLAALAAAIALGAVVTRLVWPEIEERTYRGRMLAEPVPPIPGAPRYVGIHYPVPDYASRILDDAKRLGVYTPRRAALKEAAVASGATATPTERAFGHVDRVAREGSRLLVAGWTAHTAERDARRFVATAGGGFVSGRLVAVGLRDDVAAIYREPALEFSGFRLELDYASEEAARQAMPALCLAVESAGLAPHRLGRDGADCR